MIPSIIYEHLQNFHGSSIFDIQSVGGGSINYCYKYKVYTETFFLKYNDSLQFPAIIENEVQGLHAIAETETIATPDIIMYAEVEKYEILVLPYIEQGRPAISSWEVFGEKLAMLHKNHGEFYGWSSSNYIGSLKQSNTQHENYTSFLIDERLQKQVDLANKHNLLESKDLLSFEKLYKNLPDLIPIAKPSLVHGDLWSGNYLISSEGKPFLIDPSIQYSFRETDIAFTYLFGGFDQYFYDSYNDHYPLEPNFEERAKLYNLYPLLVHLNLFGTSYLRSIQSVLKKFA